MLNKPEPQCPQPDVSRERLLEQLQSLAKRTGDIAHDLNNMLGTMIGYGSLMLDDWPVDDPNYVFLVKVVEAGAEAKQLVVELLDNARAETVRADRPSVSKAA